MTERITLPTRLEMSTRFRNLVKQRKIDPTLADLLVVFAEERHTPSSLLVGFSTTLIRFMSVYHHATNGDLITEPNLEEYIDAIVGEEHPTFAHEVKKSLSDLYRSQRFIVSDIE